MQNHQVSFFVVGLGLGAGIALLFAPKSGRQTRELIGSKAGEGREFLRHKGEQIRNKASEMGKTFQTEKGSLAAALKAGKEAYQHARGEVPVRAIAS